MPKPPKISSLWPIFAIFVVVLAFFYPVWLRGLVPIPADFIVGVYFPWLDYKWLGYLAGVPVKNPLLADIPSLIYPARAYAMELLRDGVFPLWNPLQFGGYPLLATFQSAVLYPLNFLYLIFDTVSAWTIQVMLQPLLIGIFTYLFLRQIKLSQMASLAGSIAFAFSGFNLIWLEYNVHGHVAALIPLALFLTDKFLQEKKIFWGVLLSVAFAVQIFAGYPQVTFYTAVLVVIWAIVRLKEPIFSKQGLLRIFSVILFGILGGFLSAVQIIPGLELLSLSQRISEGVQGGFEVAFLQWEQLITIFAPDFFGNPATYNFWGAGNYTNGAGYTGIVTLILASLSVLNIKKKEIKFFLFLGLFSLIVALPTTISIFFSSSGFLGVGAATATRALVLFNFALSVLAAFGIDQFERNRNLKLAIRAFYLPTIVLFGVGVGTFIAWKWIDTLVPIFSDFEWVVNLRVSLRNLILPTFLLISTGVLLLIWAKIKNFAKLAKLGLVVLLTFELFRFGWKYTPFSQRGFLFPKTPVFEFLLSQEKPFRMSGGDVIPISMWMPYRLESPSGYDAVYPARWSKFISVINSGKPKATPMGRYGSVDRYHTPLFDLTNTKYIFALKRDNKASPDTRGKPSYLFDLEKLVSIFEDKTVVVLENKKALPRAFFVARWEKIAEEEKIFERLLDPAFPLGEKIILEEDFNEFEKELGGKGEVKYLAYSSQGSKLEVKAQNPGFLFIADSWYPGWKAFVDGKETKIYRANYTFRATPVPAGKHTVEFIYDPESFKIGKWISFATLLFLVAVLLFQAIARNKVLRSRFLFRRNKVLRSRFLYEKFAKRSRKIT